MNASEKQGESDVSEKHAYFRKMYTKLAISINAKPFPPQILGPLLNARLRALFLSLREQYGVSKNPLFYLKGHLVSLLTQLMSWSAKRGRTTTAAFVPGTTTVCSVIVWVMSAARRFPRRGAS